MQLISGDKFADLGGKDGIFYLSMDKLWELKNEYNENRNLKFCLSNFPYVLITHQGDPSINEDYAFILEDPSLIHWYATNAALSHPKLTAIPVGIEYRLSKEKEAIFKEVMKMNIPKSKDIYCGFTIHPWVQERAICKQAMDRNNLVMQPELPYREYLIELKRHKFALCPIGNGYDTFRFYECQYLNVVPIIVKHINKEHILINPPPMGTAAICDSWDSFSRVEIIDYEAFVFNKINIDFNHWRKLIWATK